MSRPSPAPQLVAHTQNMSAQPVNLAAHIVLEQSHTLSKQDWLSGVHPNTAQVIVTDATEASVHPHHPCKRKRSPGLQTANPQTHISHAPRTTAAPTQDSLYRLLKQDTDDLDSPDDKDHSSDSQPHKIPRISSHNCPCRCASSIPKHQQYAHTGKIPKDRPVPAAVPIESSSGTTDCSGWRRLSTRCESTEEWNDQMWANIWNAWCVTDNNGTLKKEHSLLLTQGEPFSNLLVKHRTALRILHEASVVLKKVAVPHCSLSAPAYPV